ncbi:MAG: hypothetical protein A2Y12_19120 [Planctomycetes bacterium GWF2_42_9]|nr:MAG: hypothetical protein A2Y12_19120 [Planctomycetes bacterium GWF2_42_9]
MNSLILLHAKIHKEPSMKISDFIQNKNVEPVLINMRYVKEINQFNQNEINSVPFGYKDYLHGASSVLWFDWVNCIHVVETLPEIQQLIKGG